MSVNNDTLPSMRTEILITQNFGRAISIIGAIVVGVLFLCEVLSMNERWATLRKKENRTTLYSALSLMAVTVMGFWVEINGAMLWWIDWTSIPNVCNDYIYTVTLVYVVMKQFTYLFLFERLKIVHKAMSLNVWYLRAIRWIVFLSATVGILVIFVPLILVFFRGTVILEGVCIQYSISLVPIILFAVCDVGLSSLMLALFVAPLTQHIQSLNKTEEPSTLRSQLHGVAKRNLIISSMMMGITIASLLFMVYSISAIRANSATPHFAQEQMLHTIFAAIDGLANVVLCHVISVAWVPSQAKRIFKSYQGKKDSSAASGKVADARINASGRLMVNSSARFTDKVSPESMKSESRD